MRGQVNSHESRNCWKWGCAPIIPAAQEEEGGGWKFQASLEKAIKALFQQHDKNKRKEWGNSSNGRVLEALSSIPSIKKKKQKRNPTMATASNSTFNATHCFCLQ
jgi:hypothetical protein